MNRAAVDRHDAVHVLVLPRHLSKDGRQCSGRTSRSTVIAQDRGKREGHTSDSKLKEGHDTKNAEWKDRDSISMPSSDWVGSALRM